MVAYGGSEEGGEQQKVRIFDIGQPGNQVVGSSYPEATYLQYFGKQTGFLKVAYSDKINAPPLHLGTEMGTSLYDVQFKTSKSPECEDLDVVDGNGKPDAKLKNSRISFSYVFSTCCLFGM